MSDDIRYEVNRVLEALRNLQNEIERKFRKIENKLDDIEAQVNSLG